MIPPAVVRVTTGNFKVQPLVTIQVGVYDGERNRPSYPVDCTDRSANPSIKRRGSILKRLNEPTHLTPDGNVKYCIYKYIYILKYFIYLPWQLFDLLILRLSVVSCEQQINNRKTKEKSSFCHTLSQDVNAGEDGANAQTSIPSIPRLHYSPG